MEYRGQSEMEKLVVSFFFGHLNMWKSTLIIENRECALIWLACEQTECVRVMMKPLKKPNFSWIRGSRGFWLVKWWARGKPNAYV